MSPITKLRSGEVHFINSHGASHSLYLSHPLTLLGQSVRRSEQAQYSSGCCDPDGHNHLEEPLPDTRKHANSTQKGMHGLGIEPGTFSQWCKWDINHKQNQTFAIWWLSAIMKDFHLFVFYFELKNELYYANAYSIPFPFTNSGWTLGWGGYQSISRSVSVRRSI